MKKYTVSALTILLLNSTSVLAENSICTKGNVPVVMNATLRIGSSYNEQEEPNCPLLQNSNTSKLIKYYLPGTQYAYSNHQPWMPPSTCLSGTVLRGGTIQIGTKPAFRITGYSESAQWLSDDSQFAGYGGLFFNGDTTGPIFRGSFIMGRASTVIHVEGGNNIEGRNNIKADFVFDDQFTTFLDPFIPPTDPNVPPSLTGKDIEVFTLQGARGSIMGEPIIAAHGRAHGTAEISISLPDFTIQANTFNVTGNFCVSSQ